MAIPSKRFEFLDQETNIGTSDFLDVRSSSIFNSSNNSFTGIDADLEKFITNFFQSDKTPVENKSASTNNTLGLSRITGALTGNLRDLSSLTTRDIDNAIADILPTPTLQSAFRQVSASCKNGALTPFGHGKPYDLNMSCGDGNKSSYGGNCNSAQFSNVLNQITGGAYNNSYKDINTTLNNLLALSNYGLNMNMCGAFNALLGSVGNPTIFSSLPYNAVNRSASVLLASANSSNNILGALDIANVSGARNLTPLAENPNGVVNMFGNYKHPSKTIANKLPSMADRLFAAATIFNSNWDKSSYDNISSTVNLGKYNKELDKTLTAKIMESVGDEDNLNNIVSNNTALLKLGYRAAA